MKTKQIPYVCPVCQGTGNAPNLGTVTVTASSTNTLGLNNPEPPKCKACKGACVLWGTETDDSVDFKIYPQQEPAKDPCPDWWKQWPYYEPYKYWEHYQPYKPYFGDPIMQPGGTWCSSASDKGNLTGCPNFGF